MSALAEQLSLAADFPAASREQWQALVAATLAKSGVREPLEDALVSVTADGVRLRPLYTSADVTSGSPAVETAGWDVRQLHADPDRAVTQRAILDDLSNGVTSLWLKIGPGAIAITDLGFVLEEVLLDLAPVILDAGADTVAAAAVLHGLLSARGLDPATVTVNIGADPIGFAARTGTAPDTGMLAELAGSWATGLACVDATIYHEAGGTDADELAIAASIGVAYLRELTAAGMSTAAALRVLEFRYAVSADEFASIAKLRAAHLIWHRIAELSGAPGIAQRQHAVTSAAMMTRRDPWVNMLRTTIGCFAAAVGGAQAITVLPFDAALGVPDDFARRIARNTQAVLHDESSLGRVIDPSAGSYFIETFTREIAAVAWEKFTELERLGGVRAACQSGRLAELLAASWDRKLDRIRHRQDPITGVSEFPPPTSAAAPSAEATTVAIEPSSGLPRRRYAQVFEDLADRADAADRSPALFLATLGPAHAGRLGFARNLAQVGGLTVIEGAVSDFSRSGAVIACLCASDKVYADQAAAAATALKAAGARQVWIAGSPELVAGDIDAALYSGCDAVAVLSDMLDVIGVKP